MVEKFLHYSVNKNSGVGWLGEIPKQWKLLRLKWTINYCQNGLWGNEPDGNNDVLCVRVADFDRIRNRVNYPIPTLRSIDKSEVRNHLLRRGDLLIEKSGGGDLQPVGVVILYDSDEPAICSNFVARMPVKDEFDSNFLCYLHSQLYSSRINVKSIKQNTGIQNLDTIAYLNEKVGIPPLAEQRAIADFLDRETARIDALITKYQRLIELLDLKRRRIILDIVNNGIDSSTPKKNPNIPWIGKIPSHWRVSPLYSLFSEHKEKNIGNNVTKVLSLSYGRIIPRNVENNFGLFPESFETYNIIEPGNIILRLTDLQNDKKSLRVGLVNEKGIITSAYVCLQLNGSIIPKFAYYLLHSYDLLKVFYNFGGGIRQTMKFEDLKHMPMIVPPICEQEIIVKQIDQKIDSLDSLVVKLRKMVEHLKELRTSLITSVVTGKLAIY